MTKTQQFWQRVAGWTEFCLVHRGKAFAGWPDGTVFFYVAFHALCGSVFVVKSEAQIKAVGFAWPSRPENVADDFSWQLPPAGDCLVMMETIGTRTFCGEMFRRARARWPQVKRFFAWRHGSLVEFEPRRLRRFLREEVLS